jgi:hypothetical protein
MVKQTVALLSESFHFIPVWRHRGFSDSEAGTLYGCSMLRYVSPLAVVAHNEVIHTSRSDAALLLILGTWFGLVTANNDLRVWRLTGSLLLFQKSGAGFVSSLRFWSGCFFSKSFCS